MARSTDIDSIRLNRPIGDSVKIAYVFTVFHGQVLIFENVENKTFEPQAHLDLSGEPQGSSACSVYNIANKKSLITKMYIPTTF